MNLGTISQDMIDSLTNYDAVREKISCRLVNAPRNAEYLADKPHTMMDDLAVTYHIDLGKTPQGHATTPVTNALMEIYGVKTEELHGVALSNMEHLSPPSFKSMSETMAEMIMPDMLMDGMNPEEAAEAVKTLFPPDMDERMYVLTNQDKHHGAAAILNKRIMEEVSEKVGKEYYILPSSIHEVLIVPKTEEMGVKDLESMVQDVNATQVAPKERLSDHVYAYDAKEHRLFRADKEAERSMDRKPSISKALKSPLPETGHHAVRPAVAGDDAR